VYRCSICHAVYTAGERFCPRDAGAIVVDEQLADPRIGRTLDDRYVIKRRLGKGGMGVVYEAEHIGLERRVAIKLLATADADRDALARFRREARMASKIVHDNVVHVVDVGVADADTDFIVMELIEGKTLDKLLLERPFDVARTIAIARQLLLGLQAIHEAGIVHRDIKPANILVAKRGDRETVKIMDFGVSKPKDGMTITSTGVLVGTPEYMAPEQLRDDNVDHRADLYAAGIVMYEMLTGERPRGPSRHVAVPALDTIRADVPQALVQAVAKALAWDPNHRFADAMELVAVLDAIDVSAMPSSELETAVDRPVQPTTLTAPRRRSRRWWIIAASCSAVAVTAASIVAVGRVQRGDACADSTSLFAGRWDAKQRDAVRHALGGQDGVERLLAGYDEQRNAIAGELSSACRGLSAEQLRIRTSCLMRRAFDLGGLAAASRGKVALLEDRLGLMMQPRECTRMTMRGLPANPAPVARLYERLHAASTQPYRAEAFEEIEQEAGRLGELELETLAALALGYDFMFSSGALKATEALRRVRDRSTTLQATSVVVRGNLAFAHLELDRNDAGSAINFAKRALELVDQPELTARMRAGIYYIAGLASLGNREHQPALRHFQNSLDIIERDRDRCRSLEIDLRIALATTYAATNQRDHAVEEATRAVELARAWLGEADTRYIRALEVAAEALDAADQTSEAVAHRRDALAASKAIYGADDLKTVRARAALALELWRAGTHQEAYALAQAAFDARQRAVGYEQLLATDQALRAILGLTLVSVGRQQDGITALARAIDLADAKETPDFLEFRRIWLGWMVEANRLDGLDKELYVLDRDIRSQLQSTALMPITVAGLQGIEGAELALAQHKPEKAKELAYAGLALWNQLGGSASEEALLWQTYARSLIALRQLADAAEALDKARQLAAKVAAREDVIASIDIDAARLLAARGENAEALERARKAKAILERYPERVRALRDARALLAGAK